MGIAEQPRATRDVQIVEVGVDAAETISSIIRHAFAEYEGRIDPPSGAHHETAERIARRLAEGRGVLALRGDEPVGCVVYERHPDHVYLGRLAVLPEHRGRGVGAHLVEYVEAQARAWGLARVRLGVRVALPELRARYERAGYVLVEEHSHPGYSVPTYLMLEKRLDTA